MTVDKAYIARMTPRRRRALAKHFCMRINASAQRIADAFARAFGHLNADCQRDEIVLIEQDFVQRNLVLDRLPPNWGRNFPSTLCAGFTHSRVLMGASTYQWSAT